MKLSNKVALITGSTQGMGQSIAEEFAKNGARIIVTGRNSSKGQAVVDSIRGFGGDAHFIGADISIAHEVQNLITQAVAHFGKLDILVANAGILGLGSVTQTSLETWHQTINTNLNGVFYLCKYGIPELIKSGGGSIVINSSIAAYKSFPNHPAYCASKGALVPLTKSLAIDHAHQNIRVNCICPGPIDTPLLLNSAQAFPNPESAIENVKNATLLKRLGTGQDIANTALFLASDDSSWMTGSALTLDGGILTGA